MGGNPGGGIVIAPAVLRELGAVALMAHEVNGGANVPRKIFRDFVRVRLAVLEDVPGLDDMHGIGKAGAFARVGFPIREIFDVINR